MSTGKKKIKWWIPITLIVGSIVIFFIMTVLNIFIAASDAEATRLNSFFLPVLCMLAGFISIPIVIIIGNNK